jgi:hypothetical protein
MITVHSVPVTCAEALATNNERFFSLCHSKINIQKPTTQSYIFINDFSSIRIFTPFPDTVTYVCPGAVQTAASELKIGYTDASFHRSCSLKTKHLTLLAPAAMVDKTNLELELTIPNLAEAIEAISSDIELSQSLNLSVISEDFSKLSKFIETETIDITKVSGLF